MDIAHRAVEEEAGIALLRSGVPPHVDCGKGGDRVAHGGETEVVAGLGVVIPRGGGHAVSLLIQLVDVGDDAVIQCEAATAAEDKVVAQAMLVADAVVEAEHHHRLADGLSGERADAKRQRREECKE